MENSGVTVFELKSTIEAFLKKMGYSNYSFEAVQDSLPFIHPGQGMRVQVNGCILGFIGVLHPSLAENYKIREETALGELDILKLFSQTRSPFLFRPLSPFPMVKRDVSLVMDKNQSAGPLLQSMKDFLPSSICRDISIIDSYEGKGLEKGQKSLTFRLTLQSDKETLSEKQISRFQTKMLDYLEKKWGVHLR